MSRRRAAWAAAAAAGAAAFTFLPALSYPFLSWDDDVNVLRNADLSLSRHGVWWAFTGSRLGHWHPLTWLSLALDRALWGTSPWGFHLTNVLLHSANSGSDKLERFTETGANIGSLGVFDAKFLIRLMQANAKMFDKFGA